MSYTELESGYQEARAEKPGFFVGDSVRTNFLCISYEFLMQFISAKLCPFSFNTT